MKRIFGRCFENGSFEQVSNAEFLRDRAKIAIFPCQSLVMPLPVNYASQQSPTQLKKLDIKLESTNVPASLRPTFGQLSSIIRFLQMRPCNRLSKRRERPELQAPSAKRSCN
jgi:hypothetical protein